ncbi:SpoIIE family protein phosphatase [Streptomyces sp. HMX112]|uniref:SpoIIE family protein phosphatase n=1 Tax=Streptomyces sp. HMX112 TaxID=3390850 RepID=UPI003A803FD3
MPDSAGDGVRMLEPAVAGIVRDTGASVAMVYLLPPGERTLQLALLSGVSREFAAPWTRVALADPIPVADAVREEDLIWIGSQEEMGRRYPRPALVLPYPFALAAAPITADSAPLGGLVLLWPGGGPAHLGQREREAVRGGCGHLAELLRRAADGGRPVRPGHSPHVLAPRRARTPDPAEAEAAVAFVDRLPGGSCALDLEGRITFLTPAAAGLLGEDARRLIGALPWEVLPWMDNPTVEDRYRAALISRQSTSFTVLRPPAQWLTFALHPDASGISVRITPAPAPGGAAHPADPPTAPSLPSRATALYHLMHLAATLTEAAGVRDVADQAADQLVPALGAQAMTLFVAEEGRLRIIGHRGHRGHPAEVLARFDGAPLDSDAPTARVLSTGMPLFFASPAELHADFPTAVILGDMKAWAFLPLVASGRPVGSLVLAYGRARPFSPGERAILSSLAGLIAQALDRARLYDAKQELAHSLQASLLPHTLPRIDGLDVAARYLPAGHGVGVGGDFYDLIRLDSTTAAAAIGDVQGHNVEAAALMGQVRTAVHASAGAPPGEVLARTNRLLTDLDTDLFTSCAYAHIDLAGHRVLLATAGHPPPLLRHPDGHTEVVPVPPGLLLGIDPAARYRTTDIAFPPGALLALYTDGLVEAPGVDIDHAIGALAERLTQCRGTGLAGIAEALAHRDRPETSHHDDIALLLIGAAATGG